MLVEFRIQAGVLFTYANAASRADVSNRCWSLDETATPSASASTPRWGRFFWDCTSGDSTVLLINVPPRSVDGGRRQRGPLDGVGVSGPRLYAGSRTLGQCRERELKCLCPRRSLTWVSETSGKSGNMRSLGFTPNLWNTQPNDWPRHDPAGAFLSHCGSWLTWQKRVPPRWGPSLGFANRGGLASPVAGTLAAPVRLAPATPEIELSSRGSLPSRIRSTWLSAATRNSKNLSW